MSDIKQIKVPGTVIVYPNGDVHVDGFEIEYLDGPPDFSGCQQAFNAGAAWAIQQIAYAMTTEGFDKGGVE